MNENVGYRLYLYNNDFYNRAKTLQAVSDRQLLNSPDPPYLSISQYTKKEHNP